MSKKKKILLVLGVVLVCVLNIFIIMHKTPVNGMFTLKMDMLADQVQNIQVFYGNSSAVSEKKSTTVTYDTPEKTKKISFQIPWDTTKIRIDLGDKPGKFQLSQVKLVYKNKFETFSQIDQQEELVSNDCKSIQYSNQIMDIITNGNDAQVWMDVQPEALANDLKKDIRIKNLFLNVLMLLVLDFGVLIAYKYRKKAFKFPLELLQNRKIILGLAKNDFKTKYAGSYLGIVWAFVQPIVTILVYWFVFSVGLKAGNVSEFPFVLYLVSGIIPWLFFQDALNGGTNALIEYNYLVKKVVFKISVLPIVKIISAFGVHLFFMVFALILCAAYGYIPSLYTLQLVYYSACTFALSLALVYSTSAIVIFFRDLTQIINIFLQVGVWLTPIMWDLNMLKDHPWVMKLFKLNPMFYIVTGYRDSMLGQVWAWEHWGWTFYFWVITIGLFALGTVIFKRLKPHFADVL